MRLKFEQPLRVMRVLVTIMAREIRLKILWSRPSFGDVATLASAASHDIGARNAIESFLKSTNVWRCCECCYCSHDIGARNAIEFFQVDQRLEMLRVPLVTILKFFEVDQALEMLRVPLVTILAREMRLKIFQVDQALEMLRVPLVTILAREMRLKIFQVDQALEMLRVPLVTILAREMRLKFFWIFWSRPSFGDVASAASHDIGARNAIEIFWEVDQALEMLRVLLL